jgi:hypothetical protein
MVQRTFYALPSEAPPEEPEWEPPPDGSDTIRHGYTMSDLDQIARMAISRHIGWGDRQTMYDTAWSAAAEHIYTADQRPDWGLVVNAAHFAVMQAAKDDWRAHGRGPGPDGVNETRPHFTVYWDWAARSTSGPESSVVDRVALRQILARMAPDHVDAVTALAVHGTYQAAAKALGLSDAAFKSRISRGRARFLTLWHEGEKPSRVWGTDRRVANGGAPARGANGRASRAIRHRAARKVNAA